MTAGAALGYLSGKTPLSGETLLRSDETILSRHPPETIQPAAEHAQAGVERPILLAQKLEVSGLQEERWQHIILHHSASSHGNAAIFDLYHRNIKKMVNGLAYHFVIGNGSNSGDGEIEISRRWHSQIQGGHVKDSWYNSNSIGICLVGNFEETSPTQEQTKALIELVDYLKNILLQGKPQLLLHRDIQKTLCPGHFFPEETIKTLFG